MFTHEQYKSYLDFINEVRESNVWHIALDNIKREAAADPEAVRSFVIQECEQNLTKGPLLDFWKHTKHNVELTISEVWEGNFTRPYLKAKLVYMLKVEWVEQNCPEPGKTKQCDPLHTPKAKELFAKLRKAKKLDSHDKPLGLTTSEIGVLANIIAAELEFKNKWVVFGKKWDIDKNVLRSYYNNGMELKKIGAFIDEIKKIIQ